MSRDDDGYILVETVGAFVPFLLLIVSILSLVNIMALQARVHYALTQAANTFSMYSYVLEVTGIANDLTLLSNKAKRVPEEAIAMRGSIETVMEGINSFSDIGDVAAGAGDAATRAYGWGEELFSDPVGVLQIFLNYGADEMRDRIFEELARPLVGRYLANGSMTGDEYLKSAGVVSTDGSGSVGARGLAALKFHITEDWGMRNSEMINSDGNVKLIAQYEVEYTFGGLKLPTGPTLKITQTVVTKAWLNGSGGGYQ